MLQIKDVTKRRDDDGNYQSLRAYPSDIIAWHKAAHDMMGGFAVILSGNPAPVPAHRMSPESQARSQRLTTTPSGW